MRKASDWFSKELWLVLITVNAVLFVIHTILREPGAMILSLSSGLCCYIALKLKSYTNKK